MDPDQADFLVLDDVFDNFCHHSDRLEVFRNVAIRKKVAKVWSQNSGTLPRKGPVNGANA